MNNNDSILNLGINAKNASTKLSQCTNTEKNKALNELKKNLDLFSNEIIQENKKDIKEANLNKLSSSLIDRLTITKERIAEIIESLNEIINLDDPVGKIISEWKRPNGLNIKKISVPIGVIGIIYESRPNVTIDASAICIKSGNSVILRGGKDSFYTSHKLNDIINKSFTAVGLPKDVVQMIGSSDRSAIDELIKLDKYVDVIIPRGGKGLIKRINEKSTIPVIKHLDGICHIFVEKSADLKIAKNVILNSKMRRTGICGAAETLLIEKPLLDETMNLLQPLTEAKCEIRGDELIQKLNPNFKEAISKDWETEYLDKIISVKIVNDIEGAIKHINQYSSGHTESIITENKESFTKFYNQINSAIILQNASTQFADGGEFGFGAEIGISTDKLHVRGPVGAQHLTSYRYIIEGSGQVRP